MFYIEEVVSTYGKTVLPCLEAVVGLAVFIRRKQRTIFRCQSVNVLL